MWLFVILFFLFGYRPVVCIFCKKTPKQQQHYSPLSVKSSLLFLIILKVNQNHCCNFFLHFPSPQRPNKPSVKIILQEITVLSHLKNSILTMTYQFLECQKSRLKIHMLHNKQDFFFFITSSVTSCIPPGDWMVRGLISHKPLQEKKRPWEL